MPEPHGGAHVKPPLELSQQLETHLYPLGQSAFFEQSGTLLQK